MAVPVYYAVLGLRTGAADHEVRTAFDRLSARLHPDANPHDPYAARRYRAIEEAYAVLGDPAARRAYDAALSRPVSASRAASRAHVWPADLGDASSCPMPTPMPAHIAASVAAHRRSRVWRTARRCLRYAAAAAVAALLWGGTARRPPPTPLPLSATAPALRVDPPFAPALAAALHVITHARGTFRPPSAIIAAPRRGLPRRVGPALVSAPRRAMLAANPSNPPRAAVPFLDRPSFVARGAPVVAAPLPRLRVPRV